MSSVFYIKEKTAGWMSHGGSFPGAEFCIYFSVSGVYYDNRKAYSNCERGLLPWKRTSHRIISNIHPMYGFRIWKKE
jgi:hypothetical protein